MGLPGSSASKESTCNAGDPGSISRLGRSPGEGLGYPLQYSWASLVAQLVKNPLAMRETWVWSLGWEDPLEEGKATHSSILPGELDGLYNPWGCKESDMTEWLSLSDELTFKWVDLSLSDFPSVQQKRICYDMMVFQSYHLTTSKYNR